MISLSIAILAGGHSTRMGRDKAEMVWEGEALLERTVRIARQTSREVFVVGRERPAFWSCDSVRFYRDEVVDQGPLAGLVVALEKAGSRVLALACDMPLLSAEALDWLIAQEPGPHGVAVQRGKQWEPLFSIYDAAVLPLVKSRLSAGQRSLQGLIAAGEFFTATAPPSVAASLVNINTIEEWETLQRVEQTELKETPPERFELPTL
jgi:molybdopterin-guanine dinucleotide biosynthesis protein A